MKQVRIYWLSVLALMVAGSVFASDAASPFRLSNRIRLEADDNVYQTSSDTDSSFNIYEEIELMVNLNLETTYIGLRYRPSIVWYSDRDSGTTDFLNDLDFNLSQQFGQMVTLGITEQLRAGQLPAVESGDYRVRSDDDNIYNSVLATLALQVAPSTRLDFSGRNQILRYDEDAREADNYVIWVAGFSLRQNFGSLSTISGDIRYQTTDYKDAPKEYRRNSDTIYAGLGLEQTFSPQLVGHARGGASVRSFDLDAYDDSTDPYVELSLTYLPSPATRLTMNLGYAISESDVSYYLSENRFDASLHFAHDLTAKIILYLSAGYSYGEYDADYEFQQLAGAPLGDEDESSFYGSARVTYQLNRNNWLEMGWQYVKLDSDVQTEYDRNRVNLGWRIQLF